MQTQEEQFPSLRTVPSACSFRLQNLILSTDHLVAADLNSIDEVVSGVIKEIAAFRPGPNLESIRLALNEALANAFLHGCRGDRHCRVRICVAVEPSGGLLVSVRDPGAGFSLNQVNDPRSNQNILYGSGRGLYLMSRLADEAKVNFKTGTEIYLRWGSLSQRPLPGWDEIRSLTTLFPN